MDRGPRRRARRSSARPPGTSARRASSDPAARSRTAWTRGRRSTPRSTPKRPRSRRPTRPRALRSSRRPALGSRRATARMPSGSLPRRFPARVSRGPAAPSWDEHERALDVPGAELCERLVRLLERKRLDRRPYGDARSEGEELLAVPAREVCDGPEDALAPEDLVGERRDLGHVDARAHDRAALADGAQRGGNELAGRREDDRRVELLRRRAGAGPL